MRSDCKSKTPTSAIGNVQKAAERSIYRLMGVTVELFRLVNSRTIYNFNCTPILCTFGVCSFVYGEWTLQYNIMCNVLIVKYLLYT